MNYVAESLRGSIKMSQTFAITTFIEILVSGLLIYGFMHEDKVIAFEQFVVNCFKTCKRIVIGHYRRARRKMLYKKAIVKAERLRGKRNGRK